MLNKNIKTIALNSLAGKTVRPVRTAAFLAAGLLIASTAIHADETNLLGNAPTVFAPASQPATQPAVTPTTPPAADAIPIPLAQGTDEPTAPPADGSAPTPGPAPAAAADPAAVAPPAPADEAFPPTPDAPVTPIGLEEKVKSAGPSTLPALTPATMPTTGPVLAGTPVIAPAPATRPAEGLVGMIENLPADGRLTLLVGRSLVIKTHTPYKRVSLTQPDVASDNEVDPTSILLTAKKAGSTQLIVWDEKERSQVVDITIDVDLVALTEMVKKSFPGSAVTLSAANGTLVVRGRVPNVETADQITKLLESYGKVLNFLEMAGGQQVMLQVRFAEVSRSATTALGVNFGFADGHAGQFGNNVPGGGPYATTDGVGSLTRSVGANVTLFGGGRIGSTQFDIFLSALRSNNLLRVLAEPNLSTISGKEAQFLAGGEFPIPIPQAGGSGGTAITVEYKQFGVRLSFTPIVLGDGKIRLQGTAEVSDLDFSRSVSLNGFSIPSLTKRTVTTTIELSEGQTFAVAGLLNSRFNATKSAIPLLGDIPVFGALFRSVRYDRNETELVILVTPRLVEGMNPKQVPELPGERFTYPSENDLFLHQYLGGPGRDSAAAAKPGPIQFHGPYGFLPATNGSAAGTTSGQASTVNEARQE